MHVRKVLPPARECSHFYAGALFSANDDPELIVFYAGHFYGDYVMRLWIQEIFILGDIRFLQCVEAPRSLTVKEVEQMLLEEILAITLVTGIIAPAGFLA